MNTDILEKINRFTRRPLKEDEVYVFSVILCDNEIDRDFERFSDASLEELKDKFVGKTGISDHNATSANQTARIFDTEIVSDDVRITKTGEIYRYLKASAYMVRTGENKDLISEIDGGIKKEVSISCSAERRICSICGCDRTKGSCSHVKGRKYGEKLCYDILEGISDAYEWSFVAVPAQVNAGVTKHYTSGDVVTSPVEGSIAADEELRRDIRRLAYFVGGREAAKTVGLTARGMNTQQLITLKKSLENRRGRNGIKIELRSENDAAEDNAVFSMK